ncbi:hypothetical protein [Streptomyces sp. NBC_01443]|uniref:hypothetical protein n=1 Tax=Streptomyces sp. NBC_01443 TaxID=2903868 RepID=UPI00224F30E3|nr:hypothetical protein [Streptomyces sp. NBC_01443]MCX4632764.1 hypothetical protein [Streptomyces sp. NBC_01443]
MDIVIPAKLPEHAVDLVVPATLQSPSVEDRIRSRLTVSAPFVARLTRDQVTNAGGFPTPPPGDATPCDYFVLAFFCGYRPPPEGMSEPFVDSRIGVRLGCTDGEPHPIALSLSPPTSAAPVPPNFRFTVSVPLVVVEPAVEYAPAADRQEQYIVAIGRGQSDPEWHLKAVRNQPLVGDVQFTLLVQSPPTRLVTAEIIVAATVRRRGILRRGRADLPSLLHRIDLRGAAEPAVLAAPVEELPPG